MFEQDTNLTSLTTFENLAQNIKEHFDGYVAQSSTAMKNEYSSKITQDLANLEKLSANVAQFYKSFRAILNNSLYEKFNNTDSDTSTWEIDAGLKHAITLLDKFYLTAQNLEIPEYTSKLSSLKTLQSDLDTVVNAYKHSNDAKAQSVKARAENLISILSTMTDEQIPTPDTGDTSAPIDLSAYLKSEDAAATYLTIADAAEKYAEINSLDNYVLGTEFDSTLAKYVTCEAMEKVCASKEDLKVQQDNVSKIAATYATKAELDKAVLTASGNGDIDLTSYLTVESAYDTYAQKSSLTDYLTVSNAADTYATKVALDDYATKTLLSTYATQGDLDNYALNSELSNYAKSADLDKYSLKSDVVSTEDTETSGKIASTDWVIAYVKSLLESQKSDESSGSAEDTKDTESSKDTETDTSGESSGSSDNSSTEESTENADTTQQTEQTEQSE